MSKNLIELGILSMGGKEGGVCHDASVATAGTGLAYNWIEVASDTVFSLVTGWNENTATAYSHTNVLTGITVPAGVRFGAGFGRSFSAITIASGQYWGYERTDS